MSGLRHVCKEHSTVTFNYELWSQGLYKPYSSQPQWQAKEKDGEYNPLDLYEIDPIESTKTVMVKHVIVSISKESNILIVLKLLNMEQLACAKNP